MGNHETGQSIVEVFGGKSLQEMCDVSGDINKIRANLIIGMVLNNRERFPLDDFDRISPETLRGMMDYLQGFEQKVLQRYTDDENYGLLEQALVKAQRWMGDLTFTTFDLLA